METKTVTIDKSSLLSINTFLPLIAFTIPLFISGPQILTGSLVNCFLFLSTVYLSKKSQYLVIFLPSIGAILNGILFGKFTIFLVYFLPFIWIGNYILITTFIKKDFMNILSSSLFKSLFLFFVAFIFFKLLIVPKVFLTAMGIFQFITAVIGGLIFLGINRVVKKY